MSTPRVRPIRHEVKDVRISYDKSACCPVDLALLVIGGKWKPTILWHLLTANRPLRFAELRRIMPAITVRMLARQLRELEQHGMIYRDVYPVVPPHVEYGMTTRGKTIRPVLNTLCKWGEANGWEK